jgi:hypothetical protein
MPAHTPGPWHRADSTQVIGACGSHVADCAHAKDEGPTAGIACANAALIAAAPDLLATVKSLLWALEGCPGVVHSDIIQGALCAVSKAEGAQS